jgi:hypothetical protein
MNLSEDFSQLSAFLGKELAQLHIADDELLVRMRQNLESISPLVIEKAANPIKYAEHYFEMIVEVAAQEFEAGARESTDLILDLMGKNELALIDKSRRKTVEYGDIFLAKCFESNIEDKVFLVIKYMLSHRTGRGMESNLKVKKPHQCTPHSFCWNQMVPIEV